MDTRETTGRQLVFGITGFCSLEGVEEGIYSVSYHFEC